MKRAQNATIKASFQIECDPPNPRLSKSISQMLTAASLALCQELQKHGCKATIAKPAQARKKTK